MLSSLVFLHLPPPSRLFCKPQARLHLFPFYLIQCDDLQKTLFPSTPQHPKSTPESPTPLELALQRQVPLLSSVRFPLLLGEKTMSSFLHALFLYYMGVFFLYCVNVPVPMEARRNIECPGPRVVSHHVCAGRQAWVPLTTEPTPAWVLN